MSPIDEVWLMICSREDIPLAGARVVRRAGGADIALFRTEDDRVFALRDRCPHRGGPLSQGIVHGTSVACPLHGWNIGLADGSAVAPDQGCTRTYAVRDEGGAIYLRRDQVFAVEAVEAVEADPGLVAEA